MKSRLFHCSACGSIGPCVESETTTHLCGHCGAVLSHKSLKPWNAATLTSQRRAGKQVSSRGVQRQRKVLLAMEKDEKSEARTANQIVISILMALFLLGAGWAFYQWYSGDDKQVDQTAEILEAELNRKKKENYIEIGNKDTDGIELRKQLKAWLNEYFSEPSSNVRINYVYDAAQVAPVFDQYYILHHDDPAWMKAEIDRLILMNDSEERRYILKVKCPKEDREIVLVETDDGLKLDWQHLVSLGSEVWEGFLKSEKPTSLECRVYAWIIKGGSEDEDVYLLRMAAPVTPGSQNLGAQTPVMRVAKKSPQGERVRQIFELLPEDRQEIGIPQLVVPDPLYRRLHVKLHTTGNETKVREIKVLEIKAGDWFTLSPEERKKCVEDRYKTETPLDQNAAAE